MRRRLVLALAVPALSVAGLSGASAATGWTVVASPGGTGARLAAVSFGPSDGWTVGSRGASLSGTGLDTLTEHWDGAAWRRVPSLAQAYSDEALTGVTSTGPDNNAWAVGWHNPYGTVRVHGLVLHWNAARWTIAQDALHTNIPVAVDARTPSDVWAVGNDLFQHFDKVGVHLRSVVVLAADDAWAVGGGSEDPRPGYHHDVPYVAHWDGTAWAQVASPFDSVTGAYNSVSAVSASDIWAVGTRGSQSADPLAIHYDGTSWHAVTIPGTGDWSRLSGVAALGPNDVWAVGDRNGELPNGYAVLRTFTEHWDGTRWSIVRSPNDTDNDNYLASVDASAGTVWAVGADGNALVVRRPA